MMPTLVLPPRYTPDSIAVSHAAGRAGWQVERFASWRVPEGFTADEVVLYGEPLFATVVADALGLTLQEPAPDWLARLSQNYRQREVRFLDLGRARAHPTTAFI